MKSLRQEFIKNSIVIILMSGILILIMSALLFFGFYSKETVAVREMVCGILEFFNGTDDRKEWVSGYMFIWLVMSILIIISVILSVSRILRQKIHGYIEELKTSAGHIAKGNLDIEVLNSEYVELNELGNSIDQIRITLEKNRQLEKSIIDERKLLLANLSHDLRTPITSIKGYIEGIRDGVADTEEKMEKYLDTIYRKTMLLQSIVENMAEFSELEIGRMQYAYETVELKSYMEHLCEIYEYEAEERNLTFSKNITDKEIYIFADRNKLKRALDNLYSNALKYTKKNGKVEVSLTEEKDGAIILISDSGKGISGSDLDQIFDTFFRGDAARTNIDGTGLGLGIAKQIIEAHRGKLWVKSKEGKGTDAFIYLRQR